MGAPGPEVGGGWETAAGGGAGSDGRGVVTITRGGGGCSDFLNERSSGSTAAAAARFEGGGTDGGRVNAVEAFVAPTPSDAGTACGTRAERPVSSTSERSTEISMLRYGGLGSGGAGGPRPPEQAKGAPARARGPAPAQARYGPRRGGASAARLGGRDAEPTEQSKGVAPFTCAKHDAARPRCRRSPARLRRSARG